MVEIVRCWRRRDIDAKTTDLVEQEVRVCQHRVRKPPPLTLDESEDHYCLHPVATDDTHVFMEGVSGGLAATTGMSLDDYARFCPAIQLRNQKRAEQRGQKPDPPTFIIIDQPSGTYDQFKRLMMGFIRAEDGTHKPREEIGKETQYSL